MNGSGGQPIRLLIADDHPVVRDGLSGMFAADPDFSVVGEASDGSQALRLADAVRPDVILMDLRMPGTDGLTAIAELSRRGNPARVLVLTTYDTDSTHPTWRTLPGELRQKNSRTGVDPRDAALVRATGVSMRPRDARRVASWRARA